ARYGTFAAGESVSVSGGCLTAGASGHALVAGLSGETLARATLGDLALADAGNPERGLRWGRRPPGHFVIGDVGAVSRRLGIRRSGNSWRFRFSIPPGMSALVAAKGSVAVDGVSLTVAERRARDFDVAVIPETYRRTTLGRIRPGARMNFEADVF